MQTDSWDPKAEYTRRLAHHRRDADSLERRDTLIANGRLAAFVLGLGILGAALATSAVHMAWLLLPTALFIALVVLHEITLRRKTRAEDAGRFYERGLARLEQRWAGTGIGGQDLEPADHPYAPDLDLFGEASLFELLCTVRTRAGEEALARWLCEPASVQEIRARQEAVEELRHRLDLREDIALLGGELRATVRPSLVVRWATAPLQAFSTALRWTTTALAAVAMICLLGWAFFGFSPYPLLLVIVVEIFYSRFLKARMAPVIAGISEPEKDLEILAIVLKRLEEEPFEAPKLTGLQSKLASPKPGASGARASERIAHLHRWIIRLEQQRNVMFAPLGFLMLWVAHCAFGLERWRRANGASVPQWFEAVGEFEALCAFAAYAYEHPGDPFPELAEEGPVFRGRELGHPLISPGQCIRNDVELAEKHRALIVSGSNMSGKSTLLRTVGVNAVLAFAGAPVCAKSLELSPLAVGATLRLNDSIQSGTSRFYREITRLRKLMEFTKGPVPLLFLLDEILAGTNSHDRGIGANALIRGFIDAGAIGLVTTHDLALTKAADALGDGVRNVHFVDHLEGDRLVFDYRLHEGVVQKSNALALMRAIGLDV